MRNRALLFLCLGLFYATALTQAHSASGPSAWVYVSSQVDTTTSSEVYGFTAASNGKLTLISTAPLATNLKSMAVNGLYLFGSPTQGSNIDSYHIESDGTLTLSSTTDASTPNKCTNGPGSITLDHTGQTLYNFYPAGDSTCTNNVYQAWRITKSNGALTYINAVGFGPFLTASVISFIGNNVYAYTSNCYNFGTLLSGFKRASNGSLTFLNLTQQFPEAPVSNGWCPYLAAADPTNHLAIPLQLVDPVAMTFSGTYLLASYTANSFGGITTSNTFASMPRVAVGNVTALAMSPSGKLLAVAGTNGLQVFHFNGAKPITAFTGPMLTTEIDAIFWDNNNHLYAIGTSSNELAVFTVTPTNWSLVDTYMVKNPIGLIVQPLPRP